MPHKPSHVANTFIQRALAEGVRDMTPLKIQKLVYFLHGWHLAVRADPAIGESFEAWPYGPVLSSLYQQFKGFGRSPITTYALDYEQSEGAYKAYVVNPNDRAFFEVFDKVWEKYKGFDGLQLSALTHADGTPWQRARADGREYISDDEITACFREMSKVTHSTR